MTIKSPARSALLVFPLLLAVAWAGHRVVRTTLSTTVEPGPGAQPSSPVLAEGRPRLADFLEHYWGGRWPEARRQLIEQDVDLEGPVPAGRLRTWESARMEVRDALAGEGFPAGDFGKYFATFGARAEGDVGDPNLDLTLRSLAEEAAEQLRLALADVWERDDYARAPLAGPVRFPETEAGAKPHGLFTYTDVFQVGGWVIEVRFDSAEHAELERCLRDIRALRRGSGRDGSLATRSHLRQVDPLPNQAIVDTGAHETPRPLPPRRP